MDKSSFKRMSDTLFSKLYKKLFKTKELVLKDSFSRSSLYFMTLCSVYRMETTKRTAVKNTTDEIAYIFAFLLTIGHPNLRNEGGDPVPSSDHSTLPSFIALSICSAAQSNACFTVSPLIMILSTASAHVLSKRGL